jgi:hypothetical protein
MEPNALTSISIFLRIKVTPIVGARRSVNSARTHDDADVVCKNFNEEPENETAGIMNS